MPFKVVQTIEDGNFCLCVVPSGWEINGKLYWPNNANVTKLLKDEKSLPNDNWIPTNCIKKREFNKRVDAEKEAERMEQVEDTEQEDPPVLTEHHIQRPAKQVKRAVIDPRDFNMLIEQDDGDQLDASEILDHDPKIVYVADGNSDGILLDDTNPNQLEEIINNQTRIMKQQTKMQASLDVITEWICTGSASNSNQVLRVQQNMITPVESPEELDALEANLRDPVQMERYVNGMKHLFGTSGKANGMDVAYNLIDNFATRVFLTFCSWSGNCRSASDEAGNGEGTETESGNDRKEKVGLKFYASFRELFFRLVQLADKDFTKEDCKVFFLRVTKNSKQQLSGKMVLSKHKNRPHNLVYKKKAQKKKDSTQERANDVDDEHTASDNGGNDE